MILIFYGEDGNAATMAAAELRKQKVGVQVRHAGAFVDTEACSEIRFMGDVSEWDRGRIAGAFHERDATIAVDWHTGSGKRDEAITLAPPQSAPETQGDEDGLDPIEEARRDVVMIPDGWRGLHFNERRAIATMITGKGYRASADIDAAIETELARRG